MKTFLRIQNYCFSYAFILKGVVLYMSIFRRLSTLINYFKWLLCCVLPLHVPFQVG